MNTKQIALLRTEEGVLLLLEAHPFNGLRAPKPLIQLPAIEQVFQFDLRVGRTLAGLHCVHLDRYPERILMLDDIAGADFIAVDFHDSSGALGASYCLACGNSRRLE